MAAAKPVLAGLATAAVLVASQPLLREKYEEMVDPCKSLLEVRWARS
jgi:hypothetical protein